MLLNILLFCGPPKKEQTAALRKLYVSKHSWFFKIL